MADPKNVQPKDTDSDESSDEDFNPTAAPPDDEVSSSSDDSDEDAAATRKKPKKTSTKKTVVLDAELDSGDEATIKERKKKKRKKRKGAEVDDVSSDEAGEGGFVKTRSQRKVEKQERRPLASTKGATVDVDALWAKLSSTPIGKPLPPPPAQSAKPSDNRAVPTTAPQQEEEYITIKRTTEFAGVITTTKHKVPKSSAEARLYLASKDAEKARDQTAKQPDEEPAKPDLPGKPHLRRPLKRPSRFEPNPSGEVRTLPPELQLKWPRVDQTDIENQPIAAGAMDTSHGRDLPKLPHATKLNVVDKSRYDWVEYVDKAGIVEELDEYGRAKNNYLGRADFLDSVENKREAERREARLRGA
ncbi:hypothetical protein K402DRAFT_393863 [Aulographum hederae CBS 113979]|uniref:SWR1-complex protein 5 n=1 Tax=Aulographum hederae CBS 113979 TaxID=1176131 RepID=A0A6G1GZZ4_9PEZI|nr:hypothetical protein K402DRAFT_393863 [Aulographum hederae CBS 113979]